MESERKTHDYGSVIVKARDVAGMTIQDMLNKYARPGKHDWAWLKTSPFRPFFQHLCFSFKNQVFSILANPVDPKKRISLLPKQDIDNQIRECESNNLVPCLFDVDINTMKPISGEWNLVHSRTGKDVIPQDISDDTQVEMSPWELLNMGIETAINAIEKSGHEICSFCDVPGINPQLWFVIKGDSVPSSLTIRTVAASSTEVMTINDFIHEEKMKKYKHYFLNIELEHPAEYGYEPGKLYRAAPFHIKLKGLEPLPKALETHDYIKLEKGPQIWVKEMPEELS